MQTMLDTQKNSTFINNFWDQKILPTLQEYIKIPNKSPQFDKDWLANGYMQKATQLIYAWCQENAIAGMTAEIIQLENRTPVLFIDVPGKNSDTVLLYGHLDKQPEMVGWDSDLHPWKPVLKGDKLYGRGAADDGYAAFASLAALKSLSEQNIPHARCIILIEACEESGSTDLPYYIDALNARIGSPSLVICLDSGCGNYEQLWVTTSLRGLISGILNIEVLKQGIHSGIGSGVVPSCFRILRILLDRLENTADGNITIKDFYVEIPDQRELQANEAAKVLGKNLITDIPFIDENVVPESNSLKEIILRRTWRPALSVIGEDGLPPIKDAGNVTIPKLAVKLSLRLPPTAVPEHIASQLKNILENDPPYHAQISFDITDTGPGWSAPKEDEWLKTAISNSSENYFGKKALYIGEGGSIPFMGMLGKKFPQAQFMITGVLGPESNAHGPNEFLHIPTGKKLTACVAQVIAEHFKRISGHREATSFETRTTCAPQDE